MAGALCEPAPFYDGHPWRTSLHEGVYEPLPDGPWWKIECVLQMKNSEIFFGTSSSEYLGRKHESLALAVTVERTLMRLRLDTMSILPIPEQQTLEGFDCEPMHLHRPTIPIDEKGVHQQQPSAADPMADGQSPSLVVAEAQG
ncbi:hypothetical protein CISG_08508 [Coccidioides immitis RMSCC 3703]|uniref:Uncharacterized protein n=1 Tax=Coccidioides immitis RMSCC 3703 TaxID=454286 RepID=A0A0J8R9W8_COCIT|nr:hypothetical protein CISG_08508 [Coccidioides immitis RMSCC 3703]